MSQSKKQSAANKNGVIIMIAIGVISLLSVFGIVYAISYSNNTPEIVASNNVSIETSETSYDWGTISMDEGNVEATFEITNAGSEPLKLYNATTSCSCTSIQLTFGDENSPVYSMHTKSRYVMEVPPGETAQAKVIFDPAFHGPSGVGTITRQATIETNDQARPQLTFVTSANVIR